LPFGVPNSSTNSGLVALPKKVGVFSVELTPDASFEREVEVSASSASSSF